MPAHPPQPNDEALVKLLLPKFLVRTGNHYFHEIIKVTNLAISHFICSVLKSNTCSHDTLQQAKAASCL